jgi:hypothetical protein
MESTAEERAPSVLGPKPRCFRISSVPLNWSKDDLLVGLQAIDPFLKSQPHQLSLFPACCGPTQTALLCLDICTEYFRHLNPNESRYEWVPGKGARPKVLLMLDCHFYDLTPLNNPGDEITAESVEPCSLDVFPMAN